MNNEAVETLAQYRYDEHGQLSTVIIRNGDTVRSFSYADDVMASHSNALGLTCHYRWETLDGPWFWVLKIFKARRAPGFKTGCLRPVHLLLGCCEFL
nr:hypothetical protein [Pseudomonas putida]